MKCLVTGSTGFIGRELCRQLVAAGHQVVAYSRSGGLLGDHVTTRPVDFQTANIPTVDMTDTDAVFHLAGIAHQQAEAEDYERVNHLATVELAQRAREAGVGVFVFLSSVKAMGVSPLAMARSETDAVLPSDNYGLSKWLAESDINRQFGDGDMAVCIVRPALVYGHQVKGNLELLARLMTFGLPRPPERGARSMIDRGDLCQLMTLLASEGEPGVSTFIATDGERYSLRRVYDALRKARGQGQGSGWCPEWLWRGACSLQDALRPGSEPLWEKLFGDELYSNAQVCRASSWRPTVCLEQSLARELKTEGGDRL